METSAGGRGLRAGAAVGTGDRADPESIKTHESNPEAVRTKTQNSGISRCQVLNLTTYEPLAVCGTAF